MEPATWISLGALTIAVLGWLLNAWKAFRERRAEVQAESERIKSMSATELKADAERGNIAVHSAEAALLLMEKMLNQSNANAEKLQQRLDASECKTAKCLEELRALRGIKEDS